MSRSSGLGQKGLLGFSLLMVPLLAWAQAPQPNGKRVAVAKFTGQKITVDGRLDEPAWQTAELNGGFLQQDPKEGEPASESTEFRVLYDSEYLYIGAFCHDRTPERIVINDISRDFETLDEDYFAVVLDTFNDDRNGYYLATTAVGGQKDSQIFDEGRNNNVNWDGVWFAEARKHEEGYTVEMAIPFKTLRFSKEKAQVWGAQFYRRMRGRNESTYWSLPPRRYSLTRSIPYAGELQGIENVEPGRNFQAKPYVLAGVKRLASRGDDAEGDFDGGLDMKYGVTSGLTLDLTLNTDFSHVEADTQQVNLTRFPLFFQEKREFFLENAGIFQFGALQRSEALLFHSRTIGLENGQPIPILGGARLTGRAGRNYLGLLNMQTRSEDSTPATNFTVTRLRRDILGGSNVGAIFLNRQSRQPDDYNRSFGADVNLIFFQTDLRVSALTAKTVTPSRESDDRLGKVEGEYQNNVVRFLGSYVDIGKNFNPEMGFVRRRGRRLLRQESELRLRFTPETRLGSVLRDAFLQFNTEHALLADGRTEDKDLRFPFTFEFQDGSSFFIQYNPAFERVVEPFELPFDFEVPAGDYRSNWVNLSYTSNRSKPLSGYISHGRGGFYGGTSRGWGFGGIVRLNYRLSTSVDYERTHIELPQGKFHTDLVGVRTEYSFNPKMFLNAFIQYNNETDQVSSNIRFRLIHRPLSDIYVVYNNLRDRRQDQTDWSLSLKYTHLFSF
jgi:hypothetical protein